MNKKVKVKVRPIRTISYLFFFAMDIFFLLFLRNYFWLVIGTVLVALPFISIAGVLVTMRGIELSLGAGNHRCQCGEVVPLEMKMQNAKWYPILDSQILWEIRNRFLGDVDEVMISMPVRIHGETMLRLPLELTDPGRFSFCAKRLQMQDLLGLIHVQKEIYVEKEITVLPESEPQEDMDMTVFLAGATEVEESQKKGHDFAEVSEIRQYIPGDRIRDIHWKLTAKEGELMVKDRVSLAGSEMVLVLNLSEDKEETKRKMQVALGACDNFAKVMQPMRLLCWNNEIHKYDSYRFLGEEEKKEAFSEFLQIPLQVRLGDEKMAYLKNLYPFLDRCLVVDENRVVMKNI